MICNPVVGRMGRGREDWDGDGDGWGGGEGREGEGEGREEGLVEHGCGRGCIWWPRLAMWMGEGYGWDEGRHRFVRWEE